MRSALSQRASRIDLSLRQPLTPSVALIAAGSSGSRRSEGADGAFLRTPRSEAGGLGLEVRGPWIRGGELRASAMAGWDGAPGGRARFAAGGRRYVLSASAWSTRARPLRMLLSADSLQEIGASHEARGARLGAEVTVPAGPLSIRPAVAWGTESLRPGEGTSPTFLAASPNGSTTSWEVRVGAAVGPYAVEVGHRVRELDLGAPITRSGQGAGRVAFARSRFTAWKGGASLRSDGRRWAVSLESQRLQGELSARVETWPFVGLWETLSAQAYRLDGDLRGEALVAWLRTDRNGPGWSWGVHVDRYVALTETTSWYVTSFGFGRRDRELKTDGADPAYAVGAEVGRSFAMGPGAWSVTLAGSAVVHARRVGSRETTDDGPAGQAAVDVAWSW